MVYYDFFVYILSKSQTMASEMDFCGCKQARQFTDGVICKFDYICSFLKVIHAQLIFQLQSFPYDPKYIDLGLYRVNTN